MRKLLLLPIFVLVLAAASPIATSSASTPNTVTVKITSKGFSPATVTVQNGDIVTWTNSDSASHQVVADDGSFKSDALKPGDTFSYAFSSAGTFAYHGGMNPALKGAVSVQLSRYVLLNQKRRITTYVQSVKFSGMTSSTDSGDQVVIESKPAGATDFTEVARTATFGGHWQLTVKPRRNTDYRAVWNNVYSQVHTVYVRPALRLKQTGHRFLWAYAHADGVRIAHAQLQRWKRHRGWRTIRTLRLSHLRNKRGQNWLSFGKYRLHFRHGTILRLRVTHTQAGSAMYGPAMSKPLRF
jgi:plastocyanin